MSRYARLWCAKALWFLFVLVASALALGCASVASARESCLPAAVEVYEDTGRSESVHDVLAKPFVPLDRGHGNRGYTRSRFWMRVSLTNPDAVARPVVVELSATPSSAALYDATGALLAESGTALPFGARPVEHPRIAFRLTLLANESRVVLARVESSDNLSLDPVVWHEAAFGAASSRARLLDGIYYGILLGLAVYNLFLAYATRDRAYFAYVAFQLSTALSIAAIDKYSFQYLWPSHPIWALRSEQVLDLIALGAAFLCARWLLDTLRFAPRIDALLRVASPAVIVAGVLAAFVDPFPAELLAVAATFAVGIALLAIAAAVVTYRGNPNGRIFLLGWTLLLLGVVGAGLFAVGAIEGEGGFTLLKAGSAAEAVLLSLGLAARIRGIQREREEAREGLLGERALRIESLAVLVGAVAHELGNPLNFAKGGAAALKKSLPKLASPEAERATRALGLVETGLQRIGRMVDHLRADLDGQDAEPVPVDLVTELDDALELVGPALVARDVTVSKHGPASLHVRSHPGHLSQVFANLVRNAADASPPGGAVITITMESDTNEATVSFVDHGLGVADDLANRIFEPFFTTSAPGAGAGMGLGLFVSRQIVGRWGGTLELVPRGGEGAPSGATFLVRLPLERRRKE